MLRAKKKPSALGLMAQTPNTSENDFQLELHGTRRPERIYAGTQPETQEVSCGTVLKCAGRPIGRAWLSVEYVAKRNRRPVEVREIEHVEEGNPWTEFNPFFDLV